MAAAVQEEEPKAEARPRSRTSIHHHLGLPRKCPRIGCGRPLKWEENGATNGLDPEWLVYWTADCSCGFSATVPPHGQASMWPKSEPNNRG